MIAEMTPVVGYLRATCADNTETHLHIAGVPTASLEYELSGVRTPPQNFLAQLTPAPPGCPLSSASLDLALPTVIPDLALPTVIPDLALPTVIPDAAKRRSGIYS